MDPFIGQIIIWAGTYAPDGYAFCNGQIMSIRQNPALFSLIGNIYGGDGQTTFALPDLRNKFPRCAAQPAYSSMQSGGEADTTFTGVNVAPAATDTQSPVSVVQMPAQGKASNLPPFQDLTFVIAIYGYYPVRP